MNVGSTVRRAAWALALAASAEAAEPSGLGATLVSATFPERVACGTSFQATITLHNSGDAPWVKGEVALAAQEGVNAFSDSRRVELAGRAPVAPGESHTFTLELSAPEIALEATPTQWQLVHAGQPFGDAASGTVAVECPQEINDAEVEATLLPVAMECGQRFDGWVRLKNTGTTEWSTRESYRLLAIDGSPAEDEPEGDAKPAADNAPTKAPGVERTRAVRLRAAAVVRPGETHRFAVSMVAPRAEGTYDVAWQMAEGEDVFGEAIEHPISVRCPGPRAVER